MNDELSRLPKKRHFLSMPEVAYELGISDRSAWRLVEHNKLVVHQFGTSTRIKREDLDTYIERCRRQRLDSLRDVDDDDEPLPTT